MWYLSRSKILAEFKFELRIGFGVELSEILQVADELLIVQDGQGQQKQAQKT